MHKVSSQRIISSKFKPVLQWTLGDPGVRTVSYFMSKSLLNLLRQNIKAKTICQRSFFLICEVVSILYACNAVPATVSGVFALPEKSETSSLEKINFPGQVNFHCKAWFFLISGFFYCRFGFRQNNYCEISINNLFV